MTNQINSKFVKISDFLFSHTVSFVCFNTGPKHRNKRKETKKKIIFLAYTHTKKQPKQIDFWFVSVRTEKKLIVSRAA
jgi:hypothetical protein